LGLPDLITTSADEYVGVAVRLANDRARLIDLRQTLRDRLGTSPLMDERGFTEDLERCFAVAWERWLAKTSG
jgi:predicted O-linked N-acetylglucosamine transferase (SPINDLY family)